MRMPDTARWYVLKGRVDDARRALLRVEPEAPDDYSKRSWPRSAGALSEGYRL